MEIQFDRYRWSEVEEMVRMVAEWLREPSPLNITIKSLCGLPKGGLLVAVLLSYQTGIPLRMLDSLYDTQDWDLNPFIPPNERKSICIVDDIIDTGQTIDYWQKQGFSTVSLLCRSGTVTPAFCASIVRHHKYIMFPWECAIPVPKEVASA